MHRKRPRESSEGRQIKPLMGLTLTPTLCPIVDVQAAKQAHCEERHANHITLKTYVVSPLLAVHYIQIYASV